MDRANSIIRNTLATKSKMIPPDKNMTLFKIVPPGYERMIPYISHINFHSHLIPL
jgi:hypothetical protein